MLRNVNRVWLRMQLKKVAWITLFWIIISSFIFLYEASFYVNEACTPAGYDFWGWYGINMLSITLAGIVGGGALVFFVEQWIRTKAYWQAILLVLLIFTSVFLLVSFVGFQLTTSNFEQSEFSLNFLAFMTSVDFIKAYSTWLVITLLTVIVLLVNDKYGPGVLKKFLLGRYFRPRREERIFMFLDLRNSTSIAERMSEQKYFNLLHDVILDATKPILNCAGEIYQYVGDEIVISWPVDRGSKNANCLRCFHEIQNVFNRRAPDYLEKYGVTPKYKAGLHYGHVVAGEIGVVKRDVTYTGDVLNTTSRIQGMCNTLGVDLLLSEYLLNRLGLAPHLYEPKRIGEIALRGKREQVLLYTIN